MVNLDNSSVRYKKNFIEHEFSLTCLIIIMESPYTQNLRLSICRVEISPITRDSYSGLLSEQGRDREEQRFGRRA